MGEVVLRAVAAVGSALLCCVMTWKLLGAMQQGGYRNGAFWCWFKRKDNLFFNHLWVLSLCLALATAIVSLCFSFLGTRSALLISAVPFFVLLFLFFSSDRKYALKIPVQRTKRLKRLFAAYFFLTACIHYLLIAFLWVLARWNGGQLYGLIAYVPFAVTPMLLPVWLCAANSVMGIFENAKNKKFVKRAGQVLDECQITRVAIVGSYGKTSVKNILTTLLSEKYTVVETPASYNTPIGVAKTVFSSAFENKQVLIAEMGARKAGDIAELCALVKPDYAIFTGVCEQHLATFGDVDAVWKEKSEVIKYGAKTVCGESLQQRLEQEYAERLGDQVVVAKQSAIKDLCLSATETVFGLQIGGKEIAVKTSLLGAAAAENILLAATLAERMGLTAEEIECGLAKLQVIPHRLQLLENNGVYILDDGYNCNPRGAREAIAALGRFSGRKCIVTPGIVECGILEESINGTLGAEIANAHFEKVILVGDTLVGAVRNGFEKAGGDMETLSQVKTLDGAQTLLSQWLTAGDAVLFLNDLPDVY